MRDERSWPWVLPEAAAAAAALVLVLALACQFDTTEGVSVPTVTCSSGNEGCSVTNYLREFPDRSQCRAAAVVYPSTEQELVAAVAQAVRNGQKMRVVSKGSHSIPKLVCPGGNGTGLIISTRDYDQNIVVDRAAQTATLDAGVRLKPFVDTVAGYGLAFPHLPYWAGLSISGVLATGAHGSGLWGKGSGVYEYVTAMRLVVPASAAEGYAKVISLVAGQDDELLNAARVSLGVLGVVSTITLQLQPQFKRSITFVQKSDSDLESQILPNAWHNEFGDILWQPALKLAVYRLDNRVSLGTFGRGTNNFTGFQAQSSALIAANRISEEEAEALQSGEQKCVQLAAVHSAMVATAFGYTSNGLLFTGYPIVGYQNSLQTSGPCDDATLPTFVCPWDRRTKSSYYLQTTFSVPLAKVAAFIVDVKSMVALRPSALCGPGLYLGVLMRYVKKSSGAFLGELEDAVDVDFTYYRSLDPKTPRLDEDVMEEIEQMLLFKYKARPHWAKNRNVAFATTPSLYPDLPRFLRAMKQLDPDRLFSNEFTDAVLDVDGAASTLQKFAPFCALDGLCICSEDIHCAPASGYFCRPGLVYKEARVCRKVKSSRR
ncbi:L-gulonolactone oxidase [Marchantia polymorpha subsp. ruderalis]|uniref:L-gulonolactone oxidase n=2 Tax=Marchantia polymorpha TaxID=3197 RepID=A0AAF6BP34_MARPO|nr:hypothetical protein MARPO_0097s0030 [Marchantia polymorpha]BBN13768.1 hypothetical protein Mp_6g06140 [Marchantia polymorpha subsp. ruderalis]|eukprot:PTQ32544.1 hypothetical protein MARPO_0097s0030 [Marchantia polymorpha]